MQTRTPAPLTRSCPPTPDGELQYALANVVRQRLHHPGHRCLQSRCIGCAAAAAAVTTAAAAVTTAAAAAAAAVTTRILPSMVL